MAESYEIHVISNTHWDREWLYDFRETRMQLVEFFDRLLSVLETEPAYRSYVLDSQTIPLEDYLEVRPDKRETIARHVASGRLLVGPWYTCPEGFCINGESLVRNLLYGHRVAQSFGKVMKVGHTPFSYGQNSQMPQIYMGFGIDTMLFYHGVAHDDTPNEFIFEGADGTRILGSQMSSGARYNFYHNVYRRVLYGSRIDDREYSWTRGGLPFHMCSEEHCMEHHFLLDPVTEFHAEYIEEAVRSLRAAEIAVATTRYLAFMDGHDSSVADAAVLRIIDEAKPYLNGDTIFHSSLPDLMDKIKAAVKDLPVLRGERRVPKPMGARVHLYSDVLSTRTRMKREAARAEHALQRQAEPFAAIAWALGREYPATLLDGAWKLLLRSHAHDSIAGTGVDDIERDMFHRLRQVVNISRGITRRSLEHVQRHIDNADIEKEDVLVTVFNPSPFPRTEVVTAILDLPNDSGYHAFSLVEADGASPVPIQIVAKTPHHAVINHAGDATAMMACQRVLTRIAAREVPAFGYTTLRLVRRANERRAGLASGNNAMENEYLRVEINPDGTLRVLHKATGAQFDHLHYFQDGGEAGHAWMHIEPGQDTVVTNLGLPANITLEENGPLLARYRVNSALPIPEGLDENDGDPWQRLDGAPSPSKRTSTTKTFSISSFVTLRKGSRVVEITTRFDNVCNSHRLRAVFPTHLGADVCHVETAFDVVEREIEHPPGSPWADAINPTFPMQRFVDVSDGRVGVAILNDGLREYEILRDGTRAIAVTLLRAFEVALTTVSKRWERHPEMTLSQCPGAHEFRYAIYPHAGIWADAEVFREAERFCLPLEPAQAGASPPVNGCKSLPKQFGFLSIEPAALVLSAVKRAEDGNGLVIRLFNPTPTPLQGNVAVFTKLAGAELLTLEEKPVEEIPCCGNTVAVRVDPKKIVTLRLCT